MTIHQISVFLENRAGQLAEIAAVLAERNINLRAIHIAETSDYGVLRMIVDRSQEAASVLLEHGFILSMTPVLAVVVPDEPGALARVLGVLAKEQIDVEYMYSVFGLVSDRACMIFRVADVDRLSAVLTANHMTPVAGDVLGIH
ncbi:ACT domain-containing protein [Pseudoflavonifractor phocaeensis]|uniref:ACT domain-containing protein n=1 Tax=Pseudoflavonifractor phocaeensis TaxID=1870988 RepID=UPI00195C92E9|nr:ACT domain-containing protein [Pseudoflavonifractor phocaeensis]MBM6871491.1 ACT domain-containing protein [Pseudoflavonifractor phocaeensis]MBM6939730.1 ACT domain-containing protein [Pseudoflavonifractor phocaeensis]